MVTPRNFTGEPSSSPCTDSLKYEWYLTVSFRMLAAPKRTPATIAAAKPRMHEETRACSDSWGPPWLSAPCSCG